MSINIWTDSMQHAALLGKPVLFTNWLIQRDIIPDGWYCYDLRGTHKSPSTRTTLVDHAADYHAGTVLSPIPLKHEGNGTMLLHPFELIQQESGIQVRYRYDWHIGAMPERYTYDKTGQKQPLNELALDLIPGDYGRAVCNGRFRDWDTGIWYYVLDILNVMPLAESTDSLTSFTDREPNKIYTQIDRLW